MIINKFQLNIPAFIITVPELEDILANVPKWWGTNDKNVYDNIIFWSYDLKNYRKTNWWSKTASVGVNNKVTIRTVNTVRKLLELATK